MTDVDVLDGVWPRPAYLHTQLPVVMASDPGIARFLRGLDEMASELYERVGQKEHLFDVGLAPLTVVRRMAEQIGVTVDPLLSDDDQREIARAAAETFPIRGTKASLERNLRALTGVDVEVHDPGEITVDGAPRAAHTGTAHEPTPWGAPEAAGDGDAVVRIRMSGSGRAGVVATEAAVRRELACRAVFELATPADGQDGGA